MLDLNFESKDLEKAISILSDFDLGLIDKNQATFLLEQFIYEDEAEWLVMQAERGDIEDMHEFILREKNNYEAWYEEQNFTAEDFCCGRDTYDSLYN